VPTGKAESFRVAAPLLNVCVPKVAPPFLNVTVPVGVGPEELTVAVNLTLRPNADELPLDVTAEVVLYLSTVWVSAGDVLGEKVASPEYVAVIECGPAVSDDVVNIALPPDKPAVPSVFPPFLNVTISPSGGVPVLELIVAAKVTACPMVLRYDEDVSVVAVATLLTTCFNAGDDRNVASDCGHKLATPGRSSTRTSLLVCLRLQTCKQKQPKKKNVKLFPINVW